MPCLLSPSSLLPPTHATHLNPPTCLTPPRPAAAPKLVYLLGSDDYSEEDVPPTAFVVYQVRGWAYWGRVAGGSFGGLAFAGAEMTRVGVGRGLEGSFGGPAVSPPARQAEEV